MKTFRTTLSLGGAAKALGVFALLASTTLAGTPAFAADTTATAKKIQELQDQLQALQQQLNAMKASEAATQDAVQKEAATREADDAAAKKAILDNGGHLVFVDGKSTAIPAPPPAPPAGGVQNKNIKLTFGGFIEAAGIYRNHNETADVGSSFNGGVVFPNSTNSRLSELRGTARQSRISILAQGNIDKDTTLSAYYEMDFLGGAPTANSNESNSYQPRIRNIYATYDQADWGFHLLAGQSWSLLTLNRTGITPRTEVAPIGIEAQYVVGFNWTRNPQIRLVEDFDDHKIWVGISAESPQAQITNTGVPAGTFIVNNTGTAQLGTSGTFTADPAPDIIAKVAADPGFGHYELFGVSRWFRSQLNGVNQTSNGLGVGGSVLIPAIPKILDLQASFMYGKGMGRYGSGQLADVTANNLGQLVTLPYVSALFGAVAHPDADLDLYAYAGTEQLEKRYVSVGGTNYGYGNPAGINDTGCLIFGGTCNGQTAREYEVTGGFWYKFYHGPVGMMEFGIQDQYVKRYIFSSNATGGPGASMNIAMFSFRYYPF